jgi:ATP-binding cassette, subfamily B, bacterial
MNNPLFYLIQRSLFYAEAEKKKILLVWIGFAIAIGLDLTEPFVLGLFLNALQKGEVTAFSHVLYYLGLFSALRIGFLAIHHPLRVHELRYAFHIKVRFRERLFKILTKLPLKWHTERVSGENIDKLNRAAEALFMFSANVFEIIYTFVGLIGSVVALLLFMPLAGVLSLIVLGTAFSLTLIFDKAIYRNYKLINKSENRITSAIFDYLSNIVTVIVLRLERTVLIELQKRLVNHYCVFNRNAFLNESKLATTGVLLILIIMVGMSTYSYIEFQAGRVILAGSFFTLFEYMRKLGASMFRINFKYGDIIRQQADVSGVDDLISDYYHSVDKEDECSVQSDWKILDIKNLFFTYQSDGKRVNGLEDVTFRFERGKRYAFIGESGSGKSTALKLLRGVQKPDKSQVYFDGNYTEKGLNVLTSITTLIPQDPEIFADTIRFNVSFGVHTEERNASHVMYTQLNGQIDRNELLTGILDKEIFRAIDEAQFASVLKRLPKGLDTNIAEKGVNLSGGEKQRLALARGIFFAKDSEIILLDEPTSSVDITNERIIYTKLLNRFKDKTIISAIHKLHLLELFDEVYFFSEGKVIEHGSFQELISNNGKFKRLFDNYKIEEKVHTYE